MTTKILDCAIHSFSVDSFSKNDLFQNSSAPLVFFHGEAVDERGHFSIDNLTKISKKSHIVIYDAENMSLSIDNSDYLIQDLMKQKIFIDEVNYILDGTTLGFVEIFLLIKVLIQLNIKEIAIFYTEPEGYTRESNSSEIYNLSLRSTSFSPVPTAVLDMTSNQVSTGIFFLGYESSRIAIALDSYNMITSKDVKIVFGVPAFEPGWELKSIVPHLEIMKDNPDFVTRYCVANDPSSAYEILLSIEKLTNGDEKLFIAPIGTKPCGIATAIFSNVFSEKVGILYDHPIKATNRTYGISHNNLYKIYFKYS